MKLLYLGTPEFAVPSLRALVSGGFDVRAVLCRADKPAGRGMKAHVPAVKQAALELGLNVLQPDKLRKNAELERTLRALEPDVCVVIAYGMILPKWLLELAPHGCVNVHGSILPRLRGAAPIQHAILQGFESTGISLMRLDEGMDTGPVYETHEMPLRPDETAGELHDEMAELAARVLPDTLRRIVSGSLKPVPQDDSRATIAHKIPPEQEEIDWTRPAREIDRLVRTLSPRPGAWTTLRGKRIKILRARPAEAAVPAGELAVDAASRAVRAGCGEGSLALELVQPEGKRAMAIGEFLAGHRLDPGERFTRSGAGAASC